MESERMYKTRYFIQPWNKPVPEEHIGEQVVREGDHGVVTSLSDFGYTDNLFVASIIEDEKGKPESIAIFDAKDQQYPSVETLIAVRKAIDFRLSQIFRKQKA